jgi:hypothetical protein
MSCDVQSFDVQSFFPPMPAADAACSDDNEFDAEQSWGETIITSAVAIGTILFVSIVGVLMALA